MWITFAGPEDESVRRVEGERVRIGTAEDCELRLEAEGVASLHATLRVDADGTVTLHDEGGGVFVDGGHVDEPVALNGNETLRIGEALLVLSASDPTAEPDEPPPADPEGAIEGRAGMAAGTGIVLDAREGLVLTNFHVASVGDDLAVGKPGEMSEAKLLAAAPCEDLALLKADDLDGMRSIELGRQRDVRQGDPVVALGYPAGAANGQKLVTTAGVVATVKTPLELPIPDAPRFPNLVQTDAALAPGNSGGPLIGADGRLVGVNTAVISELGGRSIGAQGYALGVDRVRAIAADLRKGRSLGWFGAGVISPPRRALRRQNVPDGMLVTSAFADTSAADERLEGSLLTEIDGRPVDPRAGELLRCRRRTHLGRHAAADGDRRSAPAESGAGGRRVRMKSALAASMTAL